MIRLKYRPINSAVESIPTDFESENERVPDPEPEKCVTCTVLCEPPEGQQIRADVIFIHGLHGSLVKTWRQGDWKMAKNRAESVELRRRASTSCLQVQIHRKHFTIFPLEQCIFSSYRTQNLPHFH